MKPIPNTPKRVLTSLSLSQEMPVIVLQKANSIQKKKWFGEKISSTTRIPINEHKLK